MCEPVTIATGATVLAGGALSSYAQYQAGKAQAGVAENNAQLAEYQRQDAIQRGAYDAGAIMQEGRRVTASARAAISANGIDANTGSMGNLLDASMATAGVDAVRTKANAARAAWGYANEAQDLRTQAKLSRRAGILGALGTGLSGLGGAAGASAGVYGAVR